MPSPRYPLLYQANTRVWLTDLSRALGRRATLDDIPDEDLHRLAQQGFDWLWFLSVWQTGPRGQAISRADPQWREEFSETLPDLQEADIAGSGFAIQDYSVHRDLGGDAALVRLRRRMRRHGLKLMLDFVPNHVAQDHRWVEEHPEYFIAGSESDADREPKNFCRTATGRGQLVLAYGRDPHFSGWPDTLQLNYAEPTLSAAMTDELTRIASQCDGVRCDMAMLVLPEIFKRTWGIEPVPFWPSAIARVRDQHPDFLFMAEVYWDYEWTLQQQGFDYCYDKRLYDRLRDGEARSVRDHFFAPQDYQKRLARFLENHDEQRAATAFDLARHRAAAALTYLVPGLRLFHQGQLEGRRERISPHLVRAPVEPTDAALASFYDNLLAAARHPALRDGDWQLVDCLPAWSSNGTNDCFIAFLWDFTEGPSLLVVVNFAAQQSQCRVRIPGIDRHPEELRFKDLVTADTYDRATEQLASDGLYVDLSAWGVHILEFPAPP